MERSTLEFEIALLIGCVVAGLAGILSLLTAEPSLIAASVGPLAALGYNSGLTLGGLVALCGLALGQSRLGRHLEGAGITAAGVSLGIYVAHLATLRPLPVAGVAVLTAVTFAALLRAWRITGSLRREGP